MHTYPKTNAFLIKRIKKIIFRIIQSYSINARFPGMLANNLHKGVLPYPVNSYLCH